MPDIADQAQVISEFQHKIALNQSRRTQLEAKFTGFCLFCDEPVEFPRRWCDKDCCADWERENT